MTGLGSERGEVSLCSRQASAWALVEAYFSRLMRATRVPWNLTTSVALLTLVMLWSGCMYVTWATWGNLTIDSGREMYVPAVLAEGKVLYRDVWYPFGPLAPYLTSSLFRLFGTHLNVLYWTGSLSALGSAILLYLAGMRVGSRLAGFSSAALVLFQSFQPSAFSFPLAYSYAAVYGCLISCLFLWLAIGASNSKSRAWVLGAGAAAAAALLTKWEFGLACYATLGLLILAHGIQRRSWRSVFWDATAVLPGVLACAWVAYWMVSIRGFEFITQENLQSWPTSFFMRTYGSFWLSKIGFTLTPQAFFEAAVRTIIFLGIVQGLLLIASARRPFGPSFFPRLALFVAAIAVLGLVGTWRLTLQHVFFPQDMVLYVTGGAIAAWLYFLWRRDSNCSPAVPLLLTLAALVASRILFKMQWWGYTIYYNGPSVLSFVLLALPLIPRWDRSPRFTFLKYLSVPTFCLLVLIYGVRAYERTKDFVRLTTDRGTVRVPKHFAQEYQAAISFFQEKGSRGESVLSLPEDTSLYFLSSTHCPTRVFAFIPGTLAPGKMTEELIAEIDRKSVRYLLWSNREFTEYGVDHFGKDFDQILGGYLASHYRRTRRLTANPEVSGEWTADVWERKTGDQDDGH